MKTYASRAYFDAETGKEFELSKVAHVLKDFDHAFSKIAQQYKEYAVTGDVSLADALEASGFFHEKYRGNATVEARMWSYLVANVEQIESASAQQLSAQYYDTDDEYSGADVSLAEGYTAFVERIARPIEKFIYCGQVRMKIVLLVFLLVDIFNTDNHSNRAKRRGSDCTYSKGQVSCRRVRDHRFSRCSEAGERNHIRAATPSAETRRNQPCGVWPCGEISVSVREAVLGRRYRSIGNPE